jgi:high-affinity nickel-transport protein
MTLLPALALGFALGVRHATDADHIAAVGTLASGDANTRRAALVGAWWGLGHSLSVLLVGGALVLMRWPMPSRVALALEFAVALMLIALGVRAIARGNRHVPQSATRPVLIGVMHGLAGSAALALLLIAATTDTAMAAAYLVLFCVGTTVGMAAVSALFALPARLGATRALTFGRAARLVAGVASIVIGVSLALRVGVEDGLFAAIPAVTR